MDTTSEQLFSIGSVVKFTGLTSHAIRVWEKRHNAVEPKRLSNGRRMYTQADINRLSSLKQCIGLGKSISSIAHLSDKQLSNCLSDLKKNLPTPSATPNIADESSKSLALFGTSELLKNADEHTNIRICTASSDLSNFMKQVTSLQPDIILMETPSLTKQWIEDILSILTQSTPAHFIVIYRFANQKNTEILRKSGITLMRAPLAEGALKKAIADPTTTSNDSRSGSDEFSDLKAYPKRVFTPEQLTKIKNIPNKLECECPHHLVELINGLASFEQYSRDCINENEMDAVLHANIQSRTAQARHDLETLLDDVLTLEGLSF